MWKWYNQINRIAKKTGPSGPAFFGFRTVAARRAAPGQEGGNPMKKILVVGSINMDCVIRLPRRPRPGETVFCSTVSHVPGGKGANQAYALGRMGTGVSLIGAVGQDEFGRISLANLRAAGVDTTGVRVSADEDTGRAFIEVEDDGQNSIIVLGGANTHVTEQDLLAHEALFDRCEALIMQLETPLDTVTAAARLARRKGKLVLLDPAPARPDLPAELLQCVDLLKPNETELEIVSGLPADTREQCIAAARSLLDRGVGQVLVTLGARGSLLVTRDGELFVPARKVKAVDTTAAGDCFNAAFACRLERCTDASWEPAGSLAGANYREALEFATAAAAIAVTRPGAQSSIPSRAEVERSLAASTDIA